VHNRPRRLVFHPPRRAFSVAAVATVVAFFYAERTGAATRLGGARQSDAAAGESLDLESFLPAPVPDDRNFAKTPVLDALAISRILLRCSCDKMRALVRGQGPEFSWVGVGPSIGRNVWPFYPRQSTGVLRALGSPTARILAILNA